MEVELSQFLHSSIHLDRRDVLFPRHSVFIAADARFEAIDLIWSALPLLAKAGVKTSVLLVARSREEAEDEVANGALPIWQHALRFGMLSPSLAVLNHGASIPSTNSVVDVDLGLWSGGKIGHGRRLESAVTQRRTSAILGAKNFANYIDQSTPVEVILPIQPKSDRAGMASA